MLWEDKQLVEALGMTFMKVPDENDGYKKHYISSNFI